MYITYTVYTYVVLRMYFLQFVVALQLWPCVMYLWVRESYKATLCKPDELLILHAILTVAWLQNSGRIRLRMVTPTGWYSFLCCIDTYTAWLSAAWTLHSGLVALVLLVLCTMYVCASPSCWRWIFFWCSNDLYNRLSQLWTSHLVLCTYLHHVITWELNIRI